MDKGAKEIFVSTFRMVLKPRVGFFSSDKPKENGVDASNRTGKPGSATGPRAEAPQFKEFLQDCIVCEGTDATFQGVITGSGPLSVSWRHNGKRVNPNKTSFKNGVVTLTLSQCSVADAGSYTCTAENTAGSQSSSAELYVTALREIHTGRNHEVQSEVICKMDSPKNRRRTSAAKEERQHRKEKPKGPPVEFVNPLEKVEVRIGEKALLHCEFKSASLPVACCWIYNKDKVILGGTRVSFRSSESQSSVEISQACPEDQGCYTVVVRNRQGSACHTVTLSIIDSPDPPASHPVVSQLTPESLVLSWTGPSYDGGTAVLGYIVEVQEENSETWTEVTRDCKNTCYKIRSGLEPQGQYRFRVRAYNSIGVSEPSQQSYCVKMATTKEKKEDTQTYVTVIVNTQNKVKDHYNVHEKLGVGKFGQVYRMSHKETGDICAGKFYRARTSKDKAAALREIELMNCLHHPKLVQCLAAYNTRSEIVMVMEYIAGGELFARIVDDNFEHTEPTSARYMQQILEGMQYVHKQNIIHLDLKPENIVCVDTTGTQIKIIDFGLASKLDGKPLMVMHGTPEFVAPEVIGYEPVSLETDMWSLGVICYVLLSGESPFQGNSDAETLALVTAAQFDFDEESFEDISDEAQDFISSLLQKDPKSRLSCTKALAHPWMVSFTLTRRPTKSLNKSKMRRFLAKRKWKKAGKAVLALKRMANLTNRPDSPGSSLEEPGWSQEAEKAIQSLDKQLQSEPRFHQTLKDTTLPKGATAQLTCLISGYPELQVKWFQDEREVFESSRVIKNINKDGVCSLVLGDLKPSDSGVYQCRASNKLGEAMCSAKLTVTR